MANAGPSGICTLGGWEGAVGALSATVGLTGAALALANAAASVPAGPGFAGDLQPQAEVAKAKASVNRAVHERMKPPRGKPVARPKHARLLRSSVGI